MIDGDRLPTLEAPRVRLRWLTAADVDALYAVFSDPQTMRYWSSPAMKECGEAEDYLRQIHEHFAGRTLFQWGVELTHERSTIGTCTLLHLDPANGKAELGYCLGSAHWGRGYMTEALTALLDFAFTVLRLRRIEADVDPRNEASLRLLDRLGFHREGLLRERWNVGGEIQDTVFCGLLARDWWARSSLL